MIQRRLVAVLGTPCSGTRFVHKALQASGFDVGHENMGTEGIVCGWFTFNLRRFSPFDYEFDVMYRLARHPLSVLETLPEYANRLTRDKTPPPWSHEDAVIAALRWWVMTYEVLDPETPLIRLEHIKKDWRPFIADLASRTGVPEWTSDLPSVERKSKKKRWPRLTWAELSERDREWAERAHALVLAMELE